MNLRAAVGTITLVPIASSVISEQHCLVWNDGERVYMRDLGSTNGTHHVLTSRQTVSTSSEPVTLALAPAAGDLAAPPPPVEATDARDFRLKVCEAVRGWTRTQGLQAEVTLSQDASPAPDVRDIPLGDGWSLRVIPARVDATRDQRFDRAIELLWAYAREQRGEFEVVRDGEQSHNDLVLASPAIRAIHRRISQAARKGLHGVLQGESGVGKSALARCFHLHSERRDAPFIETNLGEDSDDRKYLQLKLFGARAGASTTITRDRVGLMHAADGGTLFLDEVALLPLDVQGVLLHFLDRGTYRRLGDPGDAPERRADVRIVAGTNTDLRAAVRQGAFREDLWWRLSGIVIDVPPLRDRREDIEAVLRRETVTLAGREVSVHDALTPAARRFLVHEHPWRGNFRELTNLLARLGLYLDGRGAIELDACVAALSAGSLTPVAPRAPAVSSAAPLDDADAWGDLLPLARRLLPLWLAERAKGSPDRDEARRPTFEFRVFQEEVLKPLCVARALGVEHWDEAPRRPEPSYRAMAEALGYADGKTVQTALQCYVQLKRLRARLEHP